MIAEGEGARAAARRSVRRAGAGRYHAARRSRAASPRSRLHARACAARDLRPIEEAADAVAAYLPHRPRPSSNDGLKKNLRPACRRPLALALGPALSRRARRWSIADRDEARSCDDRRRRATSRSRRCWCAAARPNSCARRTRKEFLELVPHAEYVDVAGARHMVAGDSNDHFAAAMLDFLEPAQGRSAA